MWLYDTGSNKWRQYFRPSSNTKRLWHTMAITEDDEVIIFGGCLTDIYVSPVRIKLFRILVLKSNLMVISFCRPTQMILPCFSFLHTLYSGLLCGRPGTSALSDFKVCFPIVDWQPDSYYETEAHSSNGFQAYQNPADFHL